MLTIQIWSITRYKIIRAAPMANDSTSQTRKNNIGFTKNGIYFLKQLKSSFTKWNVHKQQST